MLAVLSHFEEFWMGFQMTVLLTVVSGALALLLGLMLAVARTAPVGVVRATAASYVTALRNTPVTVILFFSAFVLPQLGVRMSYFWFAIIGLTLYHAAHFCEAIRSGINAVDRGQSEAARSVGLGAAQTVGFVVLPQALRLSVPLVINVVILLIKNTAIAAAFAVVELTATSHELILVEPQAVLEILAVTGILYLCITIPAGLLANRIERKLAFLR